MSISNRKGRVDLHAGYALVYGVSVKQVARKHGWRAVKTCSVYKQYIAYTTYLKGIS